MCLCLLHSLAVGPVVSIALADRGNEHFAALNSASLKPRSGAHSPVRAFKAFQSNTKMRQNRQSDRAELGVSVLLTQTQPLTVSDPQAIDSAPARCRGSGHRPGNADVLEEKQELNKASRFVTIATWCHRCTAQPWASADAGELLRPPERAEPTPKCIQLGATGQSDHWKMCVTPSKGTTRRFCQILQCSSLYTAR